MAANYSGPYQLRFNYQPLEVSRQFRIHMDVQTPPIAGQSFNTIEYKTRDGFGTNLQSWVDNLLSDIAVGFNSGTTTFGQVELWKYTPNTEQAQFVSSYVPTQAGTSPGANLANNQVTFTFRTLEGGIAKLVLLDTAFGFDDEQLLYPTGISGLDNIFDQLSAGDSPMLGKDTSPAFAPYQVSQGQNELLWRNRKR